MGLVYLARTPAGRRVTVKVIRSEYMQDPGFRARFAREAAAARKVGGFHTAQVVNADPEADLPWIASAYIPGPSLQAEVRNHGPLDAPTLRMLATGLSEGLKAIHDCGLVHRDLKPSNILLADDGPRIIDFGITRPVDGTEMTASGTLLGTLPYMSPEQAEGMPVGPASDMFSLGTVLAFAATGVNPFFDPNPAAVIRRITSSPPAPRGLPRNLTALVSECWKHEPTQRPTPAQVLSQFALHQPMEASFSRHRFGSTPTIEIRRPKVLGESDPIPATEPYKANLDYRRSISAHLWSTEPTVATLPGYKKSVWSVAFNPDGDTLALGSFGGSIRLWDIATRRTIATLKKSQGAIVSLAFSPDGTTLASGSSHGFVQLWDATTQNFKSTLNEYQSIVNSVTFSPDGTMLATGENAGTVHLWNSANEQNAIIPNKIDKYTHSVAFNPDSTLLAITGSGGVVHLWDIANSETMTVLNEDQKAGFSVAFSPDGSLLATGGNDGCVQLWDVANQELRTNLIGHQKSVYSVAFSPDGTALATSGSDCTVRLWDVATGESIAIHKRHRSDVHSVMFSPDGKTLATASMNYVTRLWTVHSHKFDTEHFNPSHS
jgi:WD40 repeat protein